MTTVRTAERRRDQAGEPLALYVHWPFCLSKCPYCDFNSHVREQIDQTRWRKALLAEIDHYAAIAPGRRLTSIFFGGGTPSLMPPETASAIIAHACKHWQAEAGLEITLEANPTSVETERLAHFRDAGINRISIGVQALDDKALAFLGRQHSHAQALAAIDAAATLFDSYSFDLIYARPGQTPQAWEQELARAVELARDHLSLYQLTIEPGTAFHTRFQRGQFTLPDEDTAATLFEITQIRLAAAGLPAYEVSNHAAPGRECRHNLVYWRYGEYVGVGPGAHGRVRVDGVATATEQQRAPETWLAAVERQGHGTKRSESLPANRRVEEALMMGLRLSEGIDARRFAHATGVALDRVLDPGRVERLAEGGLVSWDGSA